MIQSREDALREVEKLVKHAESLERKYNEKVWMTQEISFILPATLFHHTTFRTSSFYDGIVLFRLREFILALAFNLSFSQIQWGRGRLQAEGCFLVLQKLLLVRYCFVNPEGSRNSHTWSKSSSRDNEQVFYKHNKGSKVGRTPFFPYTVTFS